MAGVGEDRQAGEALRQGHGRQVEGVAGQGLKGADAALTEDDVGIALRQDVLAPTGATPEWWRIDRA